MAPKKTAQRKASLKTASADKTSTVKRPFRREGWKKVLERNLILEGLSPAEAKELVKISAE